MNRMNNKNNNNIKEAFYLKKVKNSEKWYKLKKNSTLITVHCAVGYITILEGQKSPFLKKIAFRAENNLQGT